MKKVFSVCRRRGGGCCCCSGSTSERGFFFCCCCCVACSRTSCSSGAKIVWQKLRQAGAMCCVARRSLRARSLAAFFATCCTRKNQPSPARFLPPRFSCRSATVRCVRCLGFLVLRRSEEAPRVAQLTKKKRLCSSFSWEKESLALYSACVRLFTPPPFVGKFGNQQQQKLRDCRSLAPGPGSFFGQCCNAALLLLQHEPLGCSTKLRIVY